MSNYFKGLTVVFEKDLHESQVEVLINAIRQLKYVIDVESHISDAEDYINREMIACEFRRKIFDAVSSLNK